MRTNVTAVALGLQILLSGISSAAYAQQPQIPTLQVCNATTAKGSGTVRIASRADTAHTGSFVITVDLRCNPKEPGYPTGKLEITRLSMSDSTIQGTVSATTFEQLTSTGRLSPTLYLNGRCKAEKVVGCRYWVMLANNKKPDDKVTADVVGFLIFNGLGQRVAYGTGPVVEGDIEVAATSN